MVARNRRACSPKLSSTSTMNGTASKALRISVAAARRLGFVAEGTLRAHLVVKGRRRDTAFFSILDEEWPARRDAIAAWLDDANWDHAGAPRSSLSAATAALSCAALS